MVLVVRMEVIVRKWSILLQFTGCTPKFSYGWESHTDQVQRHRQKFAGIRWWKLPGGSQFCNIWWSWSAHAAASQLSPGIPFLAGFADLEHPTAEDLSYPESFAPTPSWCQTCDGILAWELRLICLSTSWSSSVTTWPSPCWRVGLAFWRGSWCVTTAKAMASVTAG